MIYADTSVLVALFWAADVHAPAVLPAWRALKDRDLVWNPVHQLEAEHCLRQVRDRPARRLGEKIGAVDCGAWDLVHVAAALDHAARGEAGAEFWTCDRGQAAAARTTTLRVRLFEVKPRPRPA